MDKSLLKCKDCRHFREDHCNKKNIIIEKSDSICESFFPDGICCRYCRFFGNRKLREKEIPFINVYNPGLSAGYCQRDGLNFEKEWNDYCSYFNLNLIDCERRCDHQSLRENDTLILQWEDFPALHEAVTAEEKVKSSKEGCYIATAVYGSYDCMEVRILRRFRDEKLKENIFGRLFIRFYYAVSPMVVRHFGNTAIFNRFWKKRLDRLVKFLQKCDTGDGSH